MTYWLSSDTEETVMELRAEVMRLQVALANIVAIEKEPFGDDFCEIEEAQAIANKALDGE